MITMIMMITGINDDHDDDDDGDGSLMTIYTSNGSSHFVDNTTRVRSDSAHITYSE